MNSKLQNLNEKILLVSKLAEQNKNNISKIILEEEKTYKSDLNKNNYSFQTSINLDKNLILKGKIDSMEDNCNLKVSKLQSKFDELTKDINKINDYLNIEYESDNSYTSNLLNELNNIKNNLDNIYNEENAKLEQEINYYVQNLSNKIQEIENLTINESLNNKQYIFEIEKFSQEIISEILGKIKQYNLDSDNDKNQKTQEICNALITEDEGLNKEKNNNDLFYEEIKDKFIKSINEILNNFINIEQNKKETFKKNILNILEETLNNILINKEKIK